MDTFMVPPIALPTKNGKQFAKSPPGMLINQLQKLFDDRLISICIRLVVVDAAADLYSLACRSKAHIMLLPGKVYQPPLLRRL